MEYKHDWFPEGPLLIRVSKQKWMKVDYRGCMRRGEFTNLFVKVVKKMKKNL